MPNICHSEFLPVFLYQKGLNKFRMCIFGHYEFTLAIWGKIVEIIQNGQIGHSEFIPVFLGKIVRKNLEWPFLVILNLYQSS